MWFRPKAARNRAPKPKQEYEALLKDTLPDLRPLRAASQSGSAGHAAHAASLKQAAPGISPERPWLLTDRVQSLEELFRIGG